MGGVIVAAASGVKAAVRNHSRRVNRGRPPCPVVRAVIVVVTGTAGQFVPVGGSASCLWVVMFAFHRCEPGFNRPLLILFVKGGSSPIAAKRDTGRSIAAKPLRVPCEIGLEQRDMHASNLPFLGISRVFPLGKILP